MIICVYGSQGHGHKSRMEGLAKGFEFHTGLHCEVIDENDIDTIEGIYSSELVVCDTYDNHIKSILSKCRNVFYMTDEIQLKYTVLRKPYWEKMCIKRDIERFDMISAKGLTASEMCETLWRSNYVATNSGVSLIECVACEVPVIRAYVSAENQYINLFAYNEGKLKIDRMGAVKLAGKLLEVYL